MFFQNLFTQEFVGILPLSDRQYNLTFRCPGNAGRGDENFVNWKNGPYNLSGNDDDGNDKSVLTIYYAYDPDLLNYSALSVTVDTGAASASAVTSLEIVNNLNANATFANHFEASLVGKPQKIFIRYKKSASNFRAYVSNFGAETVLGFNARAGVTQIPNFFEKDTIANRMNADSAGLLIPLWHTITAASIADPTVVTAPAHGLTSGRTVNIVGANSDQTIEGERIVTVTGVDTFTVPVAVATKAADRGAFITLVESDIIDNAVNARGISLGYTFDQTADDWVLLAGRCGLFMVKLYTRDGDDRVVKLIEYHAGASVGSLAKCTQYTYTGSDEVPATAFEFPYILREADIIAPA